MCQVHQLLHFRCAEVLAGDGLGGFVVLRRHPCGVQSSVFENSHGGRGPNRFVPRIPASVAGFGVHLIQRWIRSRFCTRLRCRARRSGSTAPRAVRKARAGKSTVSSERSLVAKANSGRPKRTRWTYQSPRRPVEGEPSAVAGVGDREPIELQRNVTMLWGRFRVFLSLAE